ncbi:MAG: EscU/YscU/HrcU family type III secretion system export apparatus switch protein [Paracoccaceae bacterium]
MSGSDDNEKEHEPSQKRLDDARKRGEVPKSAELITAASYGGLLIAALVAGGAALLKAGEIGAVLLGQADRLAPEMMTSAGAPSGGILAAYGVALAPLFLLPMAAALLSVLAQRALIFAPEKLAPQLSRISPWSNAKHKFGREGLMAFAQSTGKLLVICTLLALFLPYQANQIMNSLWMTPAQGTVAMLDILISFLFLTLLISVVFGGADYLWQTVQHLHRNRMSRQELVDEMKDSEGDPHVKAQRRQRGQDIATNQMLLDVARADVVIVNPTHYAVALKWQRSDRSAPVCLAKGVDEIAARIRERAVEAGIPLHSDPPTARALHATVEIGDQIQPEHYRAVAAAIRFAEAMRKRAIRSRK